MVEWSASDDRVCGYGEVERVSLQTRGWTPGGNAPSIAGDVDAVAVGRTRGVRLPSADVTLTTGSSLQTQLSGGVHRLVVGAPLEPRLAFEGPATVDPSGDGAWLRLSERRPVAIGFREASFGRPTVTVPRTPSGLATAVTAASQTHRTDGPARSHPGFRPRTPRVTFGEQSLPDPLEIPTSGDGWTARESGATMTVPDSTTAVLVAAPIAYYLGATLRTGAAVPRLESPGMDHTFEPLPAFAHETSRALRKLCRFDERLRDVPGETGTRGFDDDEREAIYGGNLRSMI
jgi:hypothetical protein